METIQEALSLLQQAKAWIGEEPQTDDQQQEVDSLLQEIEEFILENR